MRSRRLDGDTAAWLDRAFGVLAVGLAGLALDRWRRAGRGRSEPPPGSVELRPVDETVLARLVGAAVSGAEPDEVTPPVPSSSSRDPERGDPERGTPERGTPERGTPERWTPERIEWLRRFHRDRRGGLDGPLGEATWAITSDGEVVGAVRLERSAQPDVLETGIWLARGARGAGVGRQAVALVLARARALGATAVRADTSPGNAAALSVLRRAGFRTSPEGDRVTAVRRLRRR